LIEGARRVSDAARCDRRGRRAERRTDFAERCTMPRARSTASRRARTSRPSLLHLGHDQGSEAVLHASLHAAHRRRRSMARRTPHGLHWTTRTRWRRRLGVLFGPESRRARVHVMGASSRRRVGAAREAPDHDVLRATHGVTACSSRRISADTLARLRHCTGAAAAQSEVIEHGRSVRSAIPTATGDGNDSAVEPAGPRCARLEETSPGHDVRVIDESVQNLRSARR